jgi:uncharacterized protein YecE (DUF72 family)
MQTLNFYGGTSGLVLPFSKSQFPLDFQDKPRLSYYASLCNSIEVNSSFYRTPKSSTVSKWASEVPDDFKFTFKLSKGITHNKNLVFELADVDNFIRIISNVGYKKGCLLVQFPPSIKIDKVLEIENLLACIHSFNPNNEWKVAVEFRHKSWYQNYIYDLLHHFKTSLVLQDMPDSATPMLEIFEDFVYLRFHGPAGSYREIYPDDFLYEYAQYIKNWREDGKIVYCYFNNTIGEAFRNLQTLSAYIGNL